MIVILAMNVVIRQYLIEAYYQGYTSGGYAFFTVDYFQTAMINDPMMYASAKNINANWTNGCKSFIRFFIR